MSRKVAMVAMNGLDPALVNAELGPRGFTPVTVVGSTAELVGQLRVRELHMVFVPLPMTESDRADFVVLEAELRRSPQLAAIGVAPTKDADVVLRAMRAGIHEFLTEPVTTEELRDAVQRLVDSFFSARNRGAIFAVHSGKGGVGCTTIAAGLTWALAHQASRPRVALLDFSTTGCGVKTLLNIKPAYDVGSVAGRSGVLDAEFVRSCLHRYDESVGILAATEDIDVAATLDVKAAGRLLEVLRADFEFTVIDTDHHFSDQTISALDLADQILLTGHAEVLSLRSMQRSVGIFSRLGYDSEKITPILNRRSDRDSVRLNDAGQVVTLPIAIGIPDDLTVCMDAVAFGSFPQERSPSSAFGEAMEELVTELTGTPYLSQRRAGQAGRTRLGRLFNRK